MTTPGAMPEARWSTRISGGRMSARERRCWTPRLVTRLARAFNLGAETVVAAGLAVVDLAVRELAFDDPQALSVNPVPAPATLAAIRRKSRRLVFGSGGLTTGSCTCVRGRLVLLRAIGRQCVAQSVDAAAHARLALDAVLILRTVGWIHVPLGSC